MVWTFVLRVGVRPWFVQPTAFLRSSTNETLAVSRRNVSHLSGARHSGVSTRITIPRRTQRCLPLVLTATSIAGLSLGISSLTSPSALYCDDIAPSNTVPPLPPPPKSSVNSYELAFGTVCGICAGIFVKKSARMAAFFFGGLFVILQYLGSMSLVRVDWARMASRFENLFYTTDPLGNRKPPTVRSVWKWVLDFLTADFQPRASFVAGFTLGLRVG